MLFKLKKSDFSLLKVKVPPTTFWLKWINLPKYTRFCSIRKLEVSDKKFGLLTKSYLMNWQIRWVKDSISGNIWANLSNFACGNRYIHVMLLPVGPQQSLLMTIK